MVIQVGDQASWPKNPNNRKPSETTPEPLDCGIFSIDSCSAAALAFMIVSIVLFVIILISIIVYVRRKR